MPITKDGFAWTAAGGVRHGLPTIGAVEPLTHFAASLQESLTYDVIVIGAGYAGLIAARDLATQGKRTLLVEGRDRLGGRTWHATVDGFNYEMGGTWVHWHMPHIYREISLYGLQDDWIVTQNPGSKNDYFTLTDLVRQQNFSHADEEAMFGRVWRAFCNLDDDDLRQSWKYPFGTKQSPELSAKWDKLSCKDRLDQIRHRFSTEEIAVLEALLIQMGGNSLDKMGLLNALRWWVLGSHQPTGLNDIALHTRLRSGNSALHRKIFEHAVSSGNLSYSFKTAVSRVEEADGTVTVTSRDGRSWKARSVISTIPLNVLASVEFSPPLPAAKVEASHLGQVNLCNKIHFDIDGPDYLSWTSFASPGKGLVCAIGDHLTPANNSHLVAFGPDPSGPSGIPLDNLDKVKEALRHLLPKEKRNEAVISRIVAHDWNKDEFSKGTWCYMSPGFTTKYIDALQKSHGNVHFASGDWSEGWRGWIDGAVQAGMEAARHVIQLQRTQGDQNGGYRLAKELSRAHI
ncbi:Monoamine oxidase N [Penicillium mononematosum]|uniref:Monoamine oxidase N n=1 Tax=Penicillium mononematosum TaxID=268346 RepID=UPI0025470682|nr:Monoamine oxidase N [Penicillium mononematosum]KAJ6186505.1 Monoamine oxidase N [Penicillium mononematosum]